ncbi:MAG TPA: hypothetical protein VFY78_12220 [Gammaproteobacteria bacterium]|nr:hypothetical protein [Gammaproteobacteria bacterium]
MKAIQNTLVLVLCLLMASPLLARELRSIEVDDTSIDLRVFGANGNKLLLGFPCDEGKSVAEEKTAQSLAEDGIEVWMPDMLSAYMLPDVKSSLDKIPVEAVVAVIDAAMKTNKQVYLIASGVDTDLILRGAAYWEQQNKPKLAGAILLFPRLFKSEPVPGQVPEYIDAVGKTRLPMVVLEGERTPNRWTINQLTAALGHGGSPVHAKLIPSVRGDFFKRQDASDSEDMATLQLDGLIKASLFYLGGTQHHD